LSFWPPKETQVSGTLYIRIPAPNTATQCNISQLNPMVSPFSS